MSNENKIHRPGDGSTGPRTPEGKERSSRNSTTHGARSTKHAILPGESEEDFEKIKQHWLDEYKPSTGLERGMVELLIERDWAFRRCERLCAEAEAKLFLDNPDLTSWSEENHRLMQRFQRYRAAAHRAYKALWADVERLRANRLKEPLLEQQLRREIQHNVSTGALTKDDLDDDPADDSTVPSSDAPETPQKTPQWPKID